jgi:nuclear pore complex protein Nup205
MARVALCDNPNWAPLTVLLGLVSCSVPIPLKAELLLTLAALSRTANTAATLWHNLEASQILTTVPSTSSYQPRGIQVSEEIIFPNMPLFVGYNSTVHNYFFNRTILTSLT